MTRTYRFESAEAYRHHFISRLAYELSERYPDASADVNWYAAEALLKII